MSTRVLSLVAMAVLAAVLGGCAADRPVARPDAPGGLPPVAAPSEPPTPARPALPGRPPGHPMVSSVHALNVNAQCQAKDEKGYAEAVTLRIENGRVNAFDAKVDIPRRGACTFTLGQFHQTRETPHIEMRSASNSRCAVRIWEQKGRVTVGFSDCEDRCTRGTYEHLWPLQISAATGACL